MRNSNQNTIIGNTAECNNVTMLQDGIECFIRSMIKEGFYRYKPPKGSLVMSNGETTWPCTEFVKPRQFIVGCKRDGSPKYLDLNAIDMNRKDFPIITKTVYDINKPYGKIEGEPIFNTAKPLEVKFPVEAVNNDRDVSIFWNHLDYLCGDVSDETKEWVKDWLADIFQDPNNKKGTALVFIGGQGCGKSIFFDGLMSVLLGDYYFYNNGKEYAEKFNLELRDRLLINFDEGFATKSKSAEAKLKSFITQSKFKIEGKGSNGTTVFNPARAVFTTNSMYAVNTADDDRRHAIFNTTKRDFITQKYFNIFGEAITNRDMLAKFMYELMNRKITSALNIPPVTEAKEAQKVLSADKVIEWFEYIITTKSDYQEALNNNSQKEYNHFDYLWANNDKNERWMFGENGFKSFSEFHGRNDNIDSKNKLFTALKSRLESHKEWGISSETKRIIGRGFIFGENAVQRVWVFKRKIESAELAV